MILTIISSILFFTSCILYLVFKVPNDLKHIPRVPLSTVIKDTILKTPFDVQVQRYESLIQKHKVVLLFSGGQWMIVTSCPKAIQTIFNDIESFPRFIITDKLSHILISKFMGRNIFTSNNEIYHKIRKVVGPAFRVPIDIDIMIPTLDSMTNFINHRHGKNINAMDLFQKTTIDILGKTILGMDFRTFDSSQKRFINAYNEVLKGSFSIIFVLFPWLDAAWNPLRSHLHAQLDYIDKFFRQVYESRLSDINHGDSKSDSLSLMIKASQETHINLSIKELRDNIMGLFTGGHETTASAIYLTLFLLANHEDEQIRVREEIFNVSKLEGGLEENLHQLHYLNACLSETVRLFPPVARQFPRIAKSNCKIRHYTIPSGTYIMVDTMALQRDPEHYKNPEQFNPSRFLNQSPDRLVWNPFIAGPHKCIGMKFSITQQKLTLSRILKFYKVQVTDQQALKLGTSFVLSSHDLNFDFIPL